MVTPLMRLSASGEADLVQETLDLRVEPKVVGTLKGKGDTKRRLGILIPIHVSGSFTSPKFRPDTKGVVKQRLEKQMEEMLQGKKRETPPYDDKIKNFMKKLPLGK
jgi:AsmA protein